MALELGLLFDSESVGMNASAGSYLWCTFHTDNSVPVHYHARPVLGVQIPARAGRGLLVRPPRLRPFERVRYLDMSSLGPSLPTFDNLGVAPPTSVDHEIIARAWVNSLNALLTARDIRGITSSLLYDQPWWRDLFALTWDIRTFQGRDKIAQFLIDRIDEAQPSNVTFISSVFQPVFPDLAWILVQFSFETAVALGRGVARLVYTKDGAWRAATVSTHLEGLKGHPERPRDFGTNHGKWTQTRQREVDFKERDPEVLVIGGGQAGLEVAARLKHLGVPNLVIEKNTRIGDNWRKRYESLNLHDPICKPMTSYL